MASCIILFSCFIQGYDMLSPKQFRELIVRPVLLYLEPEIPYSEAAENLLMGTAMQESRLTYVRQHNGGPALGLFQMEPATYSDILDNYLIYRPVLAKKIQSLAAQRWARHVPATEMIMNAAYAVALARVHYWRSPRKLPDAHDILGMADTWKVVYNTQLGRGRVEEFMDNYQKILN